MAQFNGLGMHLGNLSRLSSAETRSISPENFTGEKGKGGMATEGTGAPTRRATSARAGRSRPRSSSSPATTFDARRHRGPGRDPADLDDAGARQVALHASSASTGTTRSSRRSSARSAISSPAAGSSFAQVNSLPVCVNPGRAFNCYWEMPFRKRARITLTNIADEPTRRLLPDQLHADRCAGGLRLLPRPVPPHQSAALQGRLHDPRRRARARATTSARYMAWGVNNTGWWGEGEIKFFMDGDGDFPTICGTGTEDYFCGAYNFDPGGIERDSDGKRRTTQEFTTPYAGLPQVIRPDGVYQLADSASACTAGTSWTRSASSRTCASPSRRSAGAPRKDRSTCRCRTTSPRARSGTRPCRPRRSRALPDRDYLEVI